MSQKDHCQQTKLFKRVSIVIAISGIAALLLAAGGYAAGARINTTKSIPVGLYWTSNEQVGKGAYVLWCPSKSSVFDDAKERDYIGAGFCPGGYGYMIKRVLAAKGDAVSVTDDGVRVNGQLLQFSKPIQADISGRPLPKFRVNTYKLGDTDLLLMSDVSATSFDGRYFGPINSSQVQAVLQPVITW